VKLLSKGHEASPAGSVDTTMEESFLELSDDLDELAWLAADIAARVGDRQRALIRLHRHLDGDAVDVIERHMRAVAVGCDDVRRTAAEAALDTRGRGRSLASLAWLTRQRASLADRVRVLAGIAASTIVAAEWQSPSFAHSVRSAAGTSLGSVSVNEDDYRRDRHVEAVAYEDAYLHEYVGAPAGSDLRALATACGMAAVTTVLAFLGRTGALDGVVILGRSAYHENRELIRSMVPAERLVEVPDDDPDALVAAIVAVRPSVVMLDTLTNAPDVVMPDIPAVADAIAGDASDAVLVLDNTGRSCTFRPFETVADIRTIVIESLTKFPQFGLDRVTGGMIVARRDDARALDDLREHLGTNIADASITALPSPDRRRLDRRLSRLGRNAAFIARRLADAIGPSGRAVVGVNHPGLRDGDPGGSFLGGWFTVRFASDRDRPECHRRFVDLAIEEARRRSVPLVAGASFGFDVTRVYPIRSSAIAGRPFVRIASGMEHRLDVGRVADVLIAAARLAS
jgi:cystathionine beta-lyase/cystathionine gamma-synthase